MENTGQGNDQAAQAEKQRQQEQARRNILEQILTPEARERRIETSISNYFLTLCTVSRISIVRPEKARSLENWIIGAAQNGQIRSRLGEAELLNFLEQVEAQEAKTSTKISVSPEFMTGYLLDHLVSTSLVFGR